MTLLCNWRATLSFSLLVIVTMRFCRESPALHQPSDITVIQPQQPDHLSVCVCVCLKGDGLGSAGSSSDCFAQQIACQCSIWKKFPFDMQSCDFLTVVPRLLMPGLNCLAQLLQSRDKICFNSCDCSAG